MEIAALRLSQARQLIEAINDGKPDAFIALFARDATVVDGDTYVGRAAIRTWAQQENFDVHMHIDPVREMNTDGTEVEVKANSAGGYSGTGAFSFTIRHGLIERLEIS